MKYPIIDYCAYIENHWPRCWDYIESYRKHTKANVLIEDAMPSQIVSDVLIYGVLNGETRFTDLDLANGICAQIAVMYKWLQGKVIYRFAPEVYEALIAQPLAKQMPVEAFRRLPQRCIYMELPGLKLGAMTIVGVAATLDWENREGMGKICDLQLMLWLKGEFRPINFALPVLEGTFADALQLVRDRDYQIRERNGLKQKTGAAILPDEIASVINLILYLCADNAPDDIVPAPVRVRMRRGKKSDAPAVFDAGVRMGAAIRKARNESALGADPSNATEAEPGAATPRRSPAPHLRAAHWHHYWTGAMDGQRKLIVKWLPPIPVNLGEGEALPVMRVVK